MRARTLVKTYQFTISPLIKELRPANTSFQQLLMSQQPPPPPRSSRKNSGPTFFQPPMNEADPNDIGSRLGAMNLGGSRGTNRGSRLEVPFPSPVPSGSGRGSTASSVVDYDGVRRRMSNDELQRPLDRPIVLPPTSGLERRISASSSRRAQSPTSSAIGVVDPVRSSPIGTPSLRRSNAIPPSQIPPLANMTPSRRISGEILANPVSSPSVSGTVTRRLSNGTRISMSEGVQKMMEGSRSRGRAESTSGAVDYEPVFPNQDPPATNTGSRRERSPMQLASGPVRSGTGSNALPIPRSRVGDLGGVVPTRSRSISGSVVGSRGGSVMQAPTGGDGPAVQVPTGSYRSNVQIPTGSKRMTTEVPPDDNRSVRSRTGSNAPLIPRSRVSELGSVVPTRSRSISGSVVGSRSGSVVQAPTGGNESAVQVPAGSYRSNIQTPSGSKRVTIEVPLDDNRSVRSRTSSIAFPVPSPSVGGLGSGGGEGPVGRSRRTSVGGSHRSQLPDFPEVPPPLQPLADSKKKVDPKKQLDQSKQIENSTYFRS